MTEMGAPYSGLEVASFMTCSKGYMGECGIRGGYAEVINMDPGVMAMLQKSISAKLCPTVIGQACMDVVVNPPRPGEPSFETFDAEVKGTLASYAERAKLVADTLNSIPVSLHISSHTSSYFLIVLLGQGISCNTVQGAMYAFPQIKFPEAALAAAKEAGQPADVFYAFHLLEATGICIIPGSGFGQQPGTYHFRCVCVMPCNF